MQQKNILLSLLLLLNLKCFSVIEHIPAKESVFYNTDLAKHIYNFITNDHQDLKDLCALSQTNKQNHKIISPIISKEIKDAYTKAEKKLEEVAKKFQSFDHSLSIFLSPDYEDIVFEGHDIVSEEYIESFYIQSYHSMADKNLQLKFQKQHRKFLDLILSRRIVFKKSGDIEFKLNKNLHTGAPAIIPNLFDTLHNDTISFKDDLEFIKKADDLLQSYEEFKKSPDFVNYFSEDKFSNIPQMFKKYWVNTQNSIVNFFEEGRTPLNVQPRPKMSEKKRKYLLDVINSFYLFKYIPTILTKFDKIFDDLRQLKGFQENAPERILVQSYVYNQEIAPNITSVEDFQSLQKFLDDIPDFYKGRNVVNPFAMMHSLRMCEESYRKFSVHTLSPYRKSLKTFAHTYFFILNEKSILQKYSHSLFDLFIQTTRLRDAFLSELQPTLCNTYPHFSAKSQYTSASVYCKKLPMIKINVNLKLEKVKEVKKILTMHAPFKRMNNQSILDYYAYIKGTTDEILELLPRPFLKVLKSENIIQVINTYQSSGMEEKVKNEYNRIESIILPSIEILKEHYASMEKQYNNLLAFLNVSSNASPQLGPINPVSDAQAETQEPEHKKIRRD